MISNASSEMHEMASSQNHVQEILTPFSNLDTTLVIFSYCSLESLLLGIQLLNKELQNLIINHSEIIWEEHLNQLEASEKIKYKNKGYEKIEKGSELKSQIMLRILRQQVIYRKLKRLRDVIFHHSGDRLKIYQKYASHSNVLAGFVLSNFAHLAYVDSLANFDIDSFEFMYGYDPFFYMKCRPSYPIGFLFICCFKSKQVKNVKTKSFTQTKWKLAQDKISPTTLQTIRRFMNEFYKVSNSASLSTALIHYYQMPFKQLDNEYLTAHEYYQKINSGAVPSDDNIQQFLKSQMYHFLTENYDKFKLIVTSKKTISYSETN